MDCITFNKEIDAFLNDRLDDEQLNAFLNHLKTCDSCCEELEINYIVHEAVIRLGKRIPALILRPHTGMNSETVRNIWK